MEWNNLSASTAKDVLDAKKKLQAFIPKTDADPLPSNGKNNANDSEEGGKNANVDTTLKAKRIFNKLN